MIQFFDHGMVGSLMRGARYDAQSTYRLTHLILAATNYLSEQWPAVLGNKCERVMKTTLIPNHKPASRERNRVNRVSNLI